MSDNSLQQRFGSIAAKLQAQEGTSEKTTERRSVRNMLKTDEQNNTITADRVDLAKSEIYKILIDPDLEPKDKAEKIAGLLEFTEEDLEKNPAIIAENKAIIAQLMADYKNFNIQGMQLVHDNPLSELGSDIEEVFSKYHEIVGGRNDLDDKLRLIDELLEKHGGTEGLVEALHSAKDKEAQRDALMEKLNEARLGVEALRGDVRNADSSVYTLSAAVQEAESDSLLFFKGEKKRQLREDKQKMREQEAALQSKRTELKESEGSLAEMSEQYRQFTENEDFQLHQRILEILDIGSDDFKDRIKLLARLTMDYIDDTEKVLAGSRSQIELLLGRGQGLLNMIQNTGEQVHILLEAQNIAQTRNTAKMEQLRADQAGLSGIEALKREKVVTALNSHITSVGRGVQSSAMIATKLVEIETGQISFVDRLHEGLADAQEQEMLSIGNASMTGISTLSRVEAFAASIPGLIAKGQYQKDSEYAFGNVSKEFERALAAKMAGNASIQNYTKTVKELRESMSERNDLDIQITTQRKALIDEMISEAERLGKANEAALSIETTVNDILYGDEARTAKASPGARAPERHPG